WSTCQAVAGIGVPSGARKYTPVAAAAGSMVIRACAPEWRPTPSRKTSRRIVPWVSMAQGPCSRPCATRRPSRERSCCLTVTRQSRRKPRHLRGAVETVFSPFCLVFAPTLRRSLGCAGPKRDHRIEAIRVLLNAGGPGRSRRIALPRVGFDRLAVEKGMEAQGLTARVGSLREGRELDPARDERL